SANRTSSSTPDSVEHSPVLSVGGVNLSWSVLVIERRFVAGTPRSARIMRRRRVHLFRHLLPVESIFAATDAFALERRRRAQHRKVLHRPKVEEAQTVWAGAEAVERFAGHVDGRAGSKLSPAEQERTFKHIDDLVGEVCVWLDLLAARNTYLEELE